MAWVRQRVLVLLAITLMVFCLVYWTITSRNQLHPALKLAGLCPSNEDVPNKDNLLERLHQLQNTLEQKKDWNTAQQRTRNLINFLNGESEEESVFESHENKSDSFQENSNTKSASRNIKPATHVTEASVTSVLEVCPEQWLGPKVDHPYFFTSWKILNCANVLPFEKVLTVILYNQPKEEDPCPLKFQNVLTGIKNLYPKIPVLVSGVAKECVSANGSSQVSWISDAKGLKSGSAWNQLVKNVTTPYVLVGRDMDDFLWTTNLERQVRMISYNPDISVAGGAVRNFTGHWRVGCWQTTMRNYVLEYQEGYYTSSNSCLFCDHLLGPFVARTKIVKSIKFDNSLPHDILFEDWFWRLKQDSHRVVDCPDVMYLASDSAGYQKYVSRTPWLPLAHKWGLNRIVTPHRHVFSYTCSEAGLSCQGISSLTNSFVMPICCVEQFGSAIGVFNDFCKKHNLRYELEAGSVLGVVKMNDLMPWDLDGDISFYAANMSLFKSNSDYFKKHGVLVKGFEDKGNGRAYFYVYTPDLYSEMWGETKLSRDYPLGKPFFSVPTQVQLHGHWVYAPHSPGAYARNRYGIEIFRHVQSWSQLGMKTSWEPYKSGHFKKCKKPKHHACLDHFSVDGNIQFHVPN